MKFVGTLGSCGAVSPGLQPQLLPASPQPAALVSRAQHPGPAHQHPWRLPLDWCRAPSASHGFAMVSIILGNKGQDQTTLPAGHWPDYSA